ncbi:MAG: hypothetical protein CVU59_07040, partial [Deltaproteobacteria bacterium HGW-Deltaproteobacteria-17]
MKFSTRVRYGMRAMIELAQDGDDRPVPLAVLAQRQNLSIKYLENLFHALRDADLVLASRGPRGGYRLARPADGITVLEVISQFTGKTKQILHLTNASMRVLLTPTLSASSSMILEKAESESDDFSSEALRRSLNASLRWTPTPLVTPTLRYSETLQEEDGAPDALNR